MVFNLVFANNTISLCPFLYFFMINLHFLVSAVNAQIFNPTEELVMPAGTPTNKANSEMETQLVTEDMERRKCSK